MKTIVFKRIKRLKNSGFTFLEVIYQLVILMLLLSLLPLVLSHTDQWRYTEGFHEEIEWEYVVNEMLKIVDQYDYFSPYNVVNNVRISLYTDETYQKKTEDEYMKADAYLTVANSSIILSKNSGTEPIVYSNMIFSLTAHRDGFTIRCINEAGQIKERFFYMRRVIN